MHVPGAVGYVDLMPILERIVALARIEDPLRPRRLDACGPPYRSEHAFSAIGEMLGDVRGIEVAEPGARAGATAFEVDEELRCRAVSYVEAGRRPISAHGPVDRVPVPARWNRLAAHGEFIGMAAIQRRCGRDRKGFELARVIDGTGRIRLSTGARGPTRLAPFRSAGATIRRSAT
jgi:hypothetical protein